MNYGYDYTHSKIGEDGCEYISFMTEPETLDNRGMRVGHAVYIDIDNRKQKTTIYTFCWLHGAPRDWKEIAVLKDEIIADSEVPAIMEHFGIKITTL